MTRKTKRSNSLPTLALCIIARDEEQYIGDCLASARAFVDEIVVVDTGSTDRTREIAREYGARVENFVWCNDFAAARNAAIKAASADWIFMLDADERLEPESGPELRGLIANPPAQLHVYQVQVENRWQDNVPADAADFVPRLFRRSNVRYFYRIHEQPLLVANHDATVMVECDVRVRHLGYAPSIVQARNKDARNLQLLHAELAEQPGSARALYFLIRQHQSQNRWPEVLQAAEQFLNCAGNIKPGYVIDVYRALLTSLAALQRFDELERATHKIDEVGMMSPESWHVLATCEEQRGRPQLAVEHLQRALSAGNVRSMSWTPGLGGWQTRIHLVRLHMAMQQTEPALEQLRLAYAECPTEQRFQVARGVVRLASSTGAQLDLATWVPRAIALAPDDLEAHIELVEIQATIPAELVGDTTFETALMVALRAEDWQAAYDAAIASPVDRLSDRAQLLVVARRLADQGASEPALDILNRLLDFAPASEPFYWLLIRVLTEAGRYDDALAATELLQQMGGTPPERLAAAA